MHVKRLLPPLRQVPTLASCGSVTPGELAADAADDLQKNPVAYLERMRIRRNDEALCRLEVRCNLCAITLVSMESGTQVLLQNPTRRERRTDPAVWESAVSLLQQDPCPLSFDILKYAYVLFQYAAQELAEGLFGPQVQIMQLWQAEAAQKKVDK